MNRKRISLITILAVTICLYAALNQNLAWGPDRLEAASAISDSFLPAGRETLDRRNDSTLSGNRSASFHHLGSRIGSSAGRWMRSIHGSSVYEQPLSQEGESSTSSLSSVDDSSESTIGLGRFPDAASSSADIVGPGMHMPSTAPSAELIDEYIQAGALAIPGFDEQVTHWINSLAQESEFEAWLNADKEVLPLGPGLHGWVVLISLENEQIGYMVVGAAEDGGYRLLEYGSGSKPLYSMETLYNTLVRNNIIEESINRQEWLSLANWELERVYANGLQAIWKLSNDEEQYAIDAKSGELLPPSVLGTEDAEVAAFLTPLDELINGFSKAAADPFAYVYWMNPGHPAIEEDRLEDFKVWAQILHDEETTYVVKRFDDQVLSPYSLGGYHLWESADKKEVLFLSLDQEGNRYLPLSLLKNYGHFYTAP